ncbi:MAG TPA: hypothetical protein VHX42_04545 [Candidatus Babeliales bacterium]|jgi:hypothetical protein|nr:hypothetical protein [Candidatus Babeliales bacterium]
MNKVLKTTTLATILLTTTSQVIPTPFPSWQILISWFSYNPQPQENPDQAPAGVTIDNYIAQFRSDLNGQYCIISWEEMNEMEKALQQELRNLDIRDKDLVNQTIRSVLCNQVKIGTIRDLNALKHEGFYIAQKEYETIPTAYENNMIARLGQMRHLNGQAIAQYFGETRKTSIRNSLKNRTSYR